MIYLAILAAITLPFGIYRFALWWRREIEKYIQPLDDAWMQLQEALSSSRYLRSSTATRLEAAIINARPPFASVGKFVFPNIRRSWGQLEPMIARWDAFIDERNEAFVKDELVRHDSWFNTVCGYPLTVAQREAAVRDEDRVRVIAGAGTGKTSTVLAKALYLLQKQSAPPDSILLLAFNTNAAKEIRQRLSDAGHELKSAKTFHALGLEAISKQDGQKPSLHELSLPEEPGALPRWFEKEIEALLKDPAKRQEVMLYLASYLVPFRPRKDFKSDAEFISYVAALHMRTLKGEAVKSMGELVIANFLFLNGIAYAYEPKYHIPTATVERRQYKPDFFLPGHGIYIEYFGIGRDGKTADHVNRTDYAAGMKWKRETHASNGSKLVEVFAYDLFEHALETRLSALLKKEGVELKPVSSEAIQKLPQKEKAVTRLAGLSTTFLRLYKANHSDTSLDALAPLGDHRYKAFLAIFAPLFEKYQQLLKSSSDIDFDDMIGLAADAVHNGHGPQGLTHIIVDEFQDLSLGRKKILDAVIATNPDATLFCVGDDWQSIYRFTGSDIGMMTQFHERFGDGLTISLDSTFRYSKQLLKVSSEFIQANPSQLRKELTSDVSLTGPAVVMVRQEDGAVQKILDGIASQSPKASVLLLGRYNHDSPEISAKLLKAQFLTIHRSKGLEADYAVILNGSAGLLGFPSEIVTDPILSTLYPEADDDDYAEERRLFYVALTRARKQVFYIVNGANPSRFVGEVAALPFVRRTEQFHASRCPNCKSGEIVDRRGPTGDFLGCTNYPICEYTAKK